MAVLKMKFPLQRRVRLAQGLWLLSWLAVLSGAFTFCLGVYLKTELVRRAEVQREGGGIHKRTHAQTHSRICTYPHARTHKPTPHILIFVGSS